MTGAVVDQLREIGMSGYEAKAYLALLAAGRPLNGYEVAKFSGVPRSTVYQTLAKLVERSAAFEVKLVDSPGTCYVALSAESLLARVRREFDRNLAELGRSLPAIAPTSEASLVHHIEGRERALERAIDLVDGAQEQLFVSLWPEEAPALLPSLRRAERRGVDTTILAFGELPEPVGHTYVHQFSAPEVVIARVGVRLLVVASDCRSVLIGGAIPESMWAVWSDDPAVVLVAVEYVRHDIAMQVLVDRIGHGEVDAIWRTDPNLVRLQTGLAAPGLDQRRSRVS
ncbi:MAG TPA: helix-turn-helix domain-containing protein [Acidimicrobiales bacterium]|nr:helix-turn-helix domain-containing protein [Acidimicrobiales bacterium]